MNEIETYPFISNKEWDQIEPHFKDFKCVLKGKYQFENRELLNGVIWHDYCHSYSVWMGSAGKGKPKGYHLSKFCLDIVKNNIWEKIKEILLDRTIDMDRLDRLVNYGLYLKVREYNFIFQEDIEKELKKDQLRKILDLSYEEVNSQRFIRKRIAELFCEKLSKEEIIQFLI